MRYPSLIKEALNQAIGLVVRLAKADETLL